MWFAFWADRLAPAAVSELTNLQRAGLIPTIVKLGRALV